MAYIQKQDFETRTPEQLEIQLKFYGLEECSKIIRENNINGKQFLNMDEDLQNEFQLDLSDETFRKMCSFINNINKSNIHTHKLQKSTLKKKYSFSDKLSSKLNTAQSFITDLKNKYKLEKKLKLNEVENLSGKEGNSVIYDLSTNNNMYETVIYGENSVTKTTGVDFKHRDLPSIPVSRNSNSINLIQTPNSTQLHNIELVNELKNVQLKSNKYPQNHNNTIKSKDSISTKIEKENLSIATEDENISKAKLNGILECKEADYNEDQETFKGKKKIKIDNSSILEHFRYSERDKKSDLKLNTNIVTILNTESPDDAQSEYMDQLGIKNQLESENQLKIKNKLEIQNQLDTDNKSEIKNQSEIKPKIENQIQSKILHCLLPEKPKKLKQPISNLVDPKDRDGSNESVEIKKQIIKKYALPFPKKPDWLNQQIGVISDPKLQLIHEMKFNKIIFHDVNDESVDEILKKCEVGSFFFRKSLKYYGILSVKGDPENYNIGVIKGNGVIHLALLDDSKIFISIKELLNYYILNEFKLNGVTISNILRKLINADLFLNQDEP